MLWQPGPHPSAALAVPKIARLPANRTATKSFLNATSMVTPHPQVSSKNLAPSDGQLSGRLEFVGKEIVVDGYRMAELLRLLERFDALKSGRQVLDPFLDMTEVVR